MSDYDKQISDNAQAWYNLLSQLVAVDGGGDISAVRFGLISLTKVKIDEMMPEGEGIQFQVQTFPNTTDVLDLYINSRLDDCAIKLLQVAPLFKIRGKSATESAVNNGDGSGYVVVPSDFLRLQSFKLSGWQRELSEKDIITIDDPKYSLQKSKYTRGGTVKPVVVKNTQQTGGTVVEVFEYYSIPDSEAHSIEKFIYVPMTLAENIQTNLQDALTWLCAGEILLIMGNEGSGKAFEQMQSCFLNIK